MKEKRKKIVVRVGAMVAAVLLVALCALPAFADEGGGNYAPTNYLEQMIKQYGMTETDPLYKILTAYTNYNPYNHPNMYQFTVVPIGETLDFARYFNYEGAGRYLTATRTRAAFDGTFIVFGDGWWELSHTTQSGKKFVYFDYYESYAGDTRRAFRIRIKIDPSTKVVEDSYIASEFYSNMVGDAGRVVFASIMTDEADLIIPYGLSNGYLRTQYRINYGEFVRDFIRSYNTGYEGGYDYAIDWGYEIGYGAGYDDGMNQTSLLDGVTAIFRAPMELINSVLNFEIFGINMAVAVRVLVSMAILGVVITVVWKAVK